MTENEIKENLTFLTKEPRITGTKANKKAGKYIIEKLAGLGFTVDVQESKFMGWDLITDPILNFLKPEKRAARTIPMIWSGSTNGKVKGKLVPDGRMLTFEIYPFNKYSIRDAKNNEVGFILSNRKDPDPNKVTVWMQPLDNPTIPTPCTLLDAEDCDRIHSWLDKGEEIEVEFEVETKYNPDSSLTNIILTKKGEIADTIAICAHYDSILGSTGANDNGSGAVALMEIARQLAHQKIKHTIKFIFSDAEEWNKIGVYTYVSQLKGRDELKFIKALINIDSVGAGENIYCLAAESIGDCIEKSLDLPGSEFPIEITKQYKSPQFDAWPFHKEGVPVAQIGCRPVPSLPYVSGFN